MPFRHLIDAFAFSSLLPTGVAFLLSWMASLALVAPNRLHWAALASLGTFIVYNVDRLRDTVRDRLTSPERTAFVERFRLELKVSAAVAGLAFSGLLVAVPTEILALTLAIGSVGLLHRRIKRAAALKALYVSLAWTSICIGVPWMAAGRPDSALWVVAIVAPVLGANLIASNLRDGETQFLRTRPEVVVRIAGGFSTLGVLLAVAAPTRFLPLVWIALAQGLAILGFRPGERYGLLVIDGSLLIGAAIAALHLERIG